MSVALERPPGVIGATIVLRSGEYFDFENPEASPFVIEDIAAGLSRNCRFGGQLPDHIEHYSVAQHSVLVERIVSLLDPQATRDTRLAALLHDAPEGLGMNDMVSPLKQLCQDFKAIERRVEVAVLTRFGLPPELPPIVKRADMIALHTEKRDLSPARRHDWPGLADYPPMAERITPWPQRAAMRMFLSRFYDLFEA